MWDGSVLCWNLRCTTVSLVDVVPSGSRRVYCLKCSIYRRHYVQPLWAGLLYVKGHGLYLNVSGMNALAHLKQQNCQPLICHGSNAVTRKVESHKYVTFIRKSATPGVHHWFKLAIPKFDNKIQCSLDTIPWPSVIGGLCRWTLTPALPASFIKWRAGAGNDRTYRSRPLQL